MTITPHFSLSPKVATAPLIFTSSGRASPLPLSASQRHAGLRRSFQQQTLATVRCWLTFALPGAVSSCLDDGRYVYVSAGDCSLSERYAAGAYVYPRKSYEGVEFFIEATQLERERPWLRADFGLDIPALVAHYGAAANTSICTMNADTTQALRTLWQQQNAPDPAAQRRLSLVAFRRARLPLKSRTALRVPTTPPAKSPSPKKPAPSSPPICANPIRRTHWQRVSASANRASKTTSVAFTAKASRLSCAKHGWHVPLSFCKRPKPRSLLSPKPLAISTRASLPPFSSAAMASRHWSFAVWPISSRISEARPSPAPTTHPRRAQERTRPSRRSQAPRGWCVSPAHRGRG